MALREQLGALLDSAPDLERLTARIVQGAAYPREVLALAAGLSRAPALRSALKRCASAGLQQLAASLDSCDEARELIERAIEDPQNGTGRLLRRGYSAELDALASSASEAKQWIAALEQSERERTGIKSLQASATTRSSATTSRSRSRTCASVPDDYMRKQTLTNAERYITPELKRARRHRLNAEEKIAALERELYRRRCASVAAAGARCAGTARGAGAARRLLALAEVARGARLHAAPS